MRSSWDVFSASVLALFLREMRTRFGRYRLGYVWAVLEPAAHVLILMAIFGYVLGRTLPGIPFSAFLVVGVVTWFLFNNIATRSLGAVEANASLFNYRPVKPADTILARAVLESVIHFVVFACLMSVIWGMDDGFRPAKADWLMAFGVFLLLAIMSIGVGILLMVLGSKSREADKVVPILLRPLYFVSGVFFSLGHVPTEYHAYLLWNPILHAIELERAALFPGYDAGGASLAYLIAATLVAFTLGLALYRSNEREMVAS